MAGGGEDAHIVYTDSNQLHAVADQLTKMGVKMEEAELKMLPKMPQAVEKKQVSGLLKLLDALEDNEDVQNVFSSAEISDEDMEAAMAD